MKARILAATVLIGTLLPAKGLRHCTPLIVWVVEGSNICPCRMGLLLSQELVMVLPPLSLRAGPRKAEKSPCRSWSVGTVLRLVEPCFCRYCSQEKKKKVLSCPLYSLGIQTGPPTDPP